MTRQDDAGFTLIEALVAMAVLALGAVSLLSATQGHSKRNTELSDRVAARWAAEYRLSEVRVGVQTGAEPLEVYGIEFDLNVTRRPTNDPAVQAVSVDSALSGTDRVLYILDGYVAAGDPL